MARKRMIDPELWRDRKVIRLSNAELIIWIGCISNADDEGILEVDPQSLYFELARQEVSTEDIQAAIDKLTGLKMLVCYGNHYAFIPSWFKHQTLDRPKHTKLRRPPEPVLKQHPGYVEAWERTFSTRDNPVTYPFSTCVEESTSDPEPEEPSERAEEVARDESETDRAEENIEPDQEYRVNDESSTRCTEEKSVIFPFEPSDRHVDDLSTINRRSLDAKRKERNRIEKNSSIAASKSRPRKESPPPSSPKPEKHEHSRGETKLYHAVKEAFLSKNGGTFTNWGKEGKSIKQLVEKAEARAPDAPEAFLEQIITQFWRLKQSRDRFWKEQPFLPSALNASGIFDRVLEHFREDEPNEEYSRILQEVFG